jgi:hypothetical protein
LINSLDFSSVVSIALPWSAIVTARELRIVPISTDLYLSARQSYSVLTTLAFSDIPSF